jgi:hypothetical protein
VSQLKNDLIVTGIPRGGTTLTAALIDNLSNCVCLSEPGWQSKWFLEGKKAGTLVKLITADFQDVRKKILNKEPIKDKRKADGTPLTNYFQAPKNGVRQKDKKGGKRSIVFPVENENFTLGMKHNAHYTSILPELIQSDNFSIIAIIRHPVPTILSWLSLDIPISRGQLPAGEEVWSELRNITMSKDKLLMKQIRIYDLFCQRYLDYSSHIHLIKYEDIVNDSTIINKITGKTYEKELNMQNQNQSKHYEYKMEEKIREMITMHAPHALKLYSL